MRGRVLEWADKRRLKAIGLFTSTHIAAPTSLLIRNRVNSDGTKARNHISLQGEEDTFAGEGTKTRSMYPVYLSPRCIILKFDQRRSFCNGLCKLYPSGVFLFQSFLFDVSKTWQGALAICPTRT